MNVMLKHRLIVRGIILGTMLCAIQGASAEGTLDDYKRAFNMRETTANKVFKDRVREKWFKDNSRFWYQNDLPDEKREFVLVDAEAGVRKAAFDHERLAEALGKVSGEEISADKLTIEKLEFSESGLELEFKSKGKKWKCDLQSYVLEMLSKDERAGGSLEPGYRIRPSRRSDEETWITFTNQTDDDVEIYWIDTERQRHHYFTLAAGESRRQHTFAGHVWLVLDKAKEKGAVFIAGEEAGKAVVTEECLSEKINRRRQGRRARQVRAESPDGKWTAFIKENNLYISNGEDETEIALSSDGTEEDAYREQFYWSGDSRKLVGVRVRKGEQRKVHFVEAAPKDQLQPKLHTISYTKPGDRIDHPRPVLFDVADRRVIGISDELFANPWSITQIRWAADSSRFSFIYNQRGHQVLRIISVDADTGATRGIVDEKSVH